MPGNAIVEELIFKLLRPENCEASFDELRRADDEGGCQDAEMAALVSRVACTALAVRKALADEISIIFGRWDRPQEIRLRAGEMTAQEMRSVRACLAGVHAQVSRAVLPASMNVPPSEDVPPSERLGYEPTVRLIGSFGRAAGLSAVCDRLSPEQFAPVWSAIVGIIVAEARFMRSDDCDLVRDLTDGPTLIPEVRGKIASHLQLDPRTSGDFFAALVEELTRYLADGGSVSGLWGKVEVRDGRLVLVLLKRDTPRVYAVATSSMLDIDL